MSKAACSALVLLCLPMAAWAEPAPPNDDDPLAPARQRGGMYVEPPVIEDPIYIPEGPASAPPPHAASATRPRFEATAAYNYPLDDSGGTGSGTQGTRLGGQTAELRLRASDFVTQGVFAHISLYHYVEPAKRKSWNPDFAYSFGYSPYREGTWHAMYANYTGTRFQPDASQGESRWNFDQGQWSVGYTMRPPFAPRWMQGEGVVNRCAADLNVVPRYVDAASPESRSGKTFATFGCRHERPEGWFAHVTLYGWVRHDAQQPWDPDFTYGFGYQEPHEQRWSVQYNNYANSRYPWRPHEPTNEGFRGGALAASISVRW